MIGAIELDGQLPFAGRYQIVRRIAAGGMGAVYEVVHIETRRRRALKVMLPELVMNGELRDRFQMEARVTAVVDSEYIVDVFDAGIDGTTGMPFLVMELLQGEELGEVLRRSGPVAPTDALAYLRQVASALDKTHAAGIVHRDLKPENLFLTHREDGSPRIKILDFGISKVVSEANTGANATRSLGTPLYMAPEQVFGQSVSAATDLYSLGLIAYTLLVGVSYWQVDTDKFENAIAFALHTTKGASESAVTRAGRLGRSLPESFDAWFRRATHLEPALRFQRASELVNELALLLGVGGGAQARMAASAPLPVAPTSGNAIGEMALGTVPSWAATSPPAKPRTRAIGSVGAGMLVVALVAFAFHFRKAAPAAPAIPEASVVVPAAAQAAQPSEPAQEVKPPEPSPELSATTGMLDVDLAKASHPHVAAASTKALTVPAVPLASPKANCTPNFYLDAEGDKHFKPECFGAHSNSR